MNEQMLVERFLRHARRFGPEAVLDTASCYLDEPALHRLAAALEDAPSQPPISLRTRQKQTGRDSPTPGAFRNRCPLCGAPLPRSERGRRRRFCSPACRQHAYRERVCAKRAANDVREHDPTSGQKETQAA